MTATEHIRPDLRKALDFALESYRQALADYRAGLLDEDELRRALFRSGLVQWPDSAWLLDLQEGRWWRYDGVGLDRANGHHVVDDPGVARLRDVINEVARDSRAAAGGGDR